MVQHVAWVCATSSFTRASASFNTANPPRRTDAESTSKSSGLGKATGLGHKRKPHHFRPRAGAILVGPWVVWGRRAAGQKTMNQPLARVRARARASARLSQTASSANTRLRSQPLQTRKRSGTAPAAFVTPCSPFAHARARAFSTPQNSETQQHAGPKRPKNEAVSGPKTVRPNPVMKAFARASA